MTTYEAVLKHLIDLGLVSSEHDGNRWLTKEKTPGFEGKTAAELMTYGHTDAAFECIDRISDGGYA
ncbi:MAG: hypothetical protein QM500_10330 [Methylococcales bacterium]